ncbi:hypothetical protein ACOXVJ_08290 [Pseudomonas knackmussii]|uniref:hypothetical protein n=1 Tax=Pseudomonas knackmussii TaxID=65741 RepID=UPI003BC8A978
MHDAYTPTTFLRFNRPLRAVLIDDQPWFAARDFGRLMGQRPCSPMLAAPRAKR